MTHELLTKTENSPASAGPSPSAPAEEAVASTGRSAGFLVWLGQTIPTLLVLTALAGLGYWGHHTGWKLPKFSELNGTAQTEEDDWCEAHGVPDPECVECKPELLPLKDYGFCKKHGVHNCAFEHPDVAPTDELPEISPDDLERAERALALKERPENNPQCTLYKRRIQFTSEEAMAKAGVDVHVVRQRPMVEVIAAYGEITYDPNRVARLTTPIPGRIWRVEKQVGQAVKAGDLLALVDAAEVGKAKGEFLQAFALVDQKARALQIVEDLIKSGTYRKGASQELETGAALREAQIRLLSVQQALLNLGLPVRAEDLKGLSPDEVAERVRFLGIPESVTKTLDRQTATSNLIPVKATLDGVVVSHEAVPVPGELADATKTLFVIADVSRMWLTLNVRQEDAKYVKLGQPVRFRLEENPKTGYVTGEIFWIDTALDDKTRTLKVRASLDNRARQLRAHTFVREGQIILRAEKSTVVVPNEAVHWDGSCYIMFVRDKNFRKKDALKVFHTRTVRLGAKEKEHTEIIAGVLPWEVVASKGSDVLRAQLLRNNLGAG